MRCETTSSTDESQAAMLAWCDMSSTLMGRVRRWHLHQELLLKSMSSRKSGAIREVWEKSKLYE